jgi:Leucine-rich repeat (LRR) protein
LQGPTIQTIQVQGNGLTSFPFEALKPYSELTAFVAFDNYLAEVPAGAFAGVSQQLRSILLYNNAIASIGDGAFWNLTSLVTLILERNQLTALGPGSLRLSGVVPSVVFYRFKRKNVILPSNYDY